MPERVMSMLANLTGGKSYKAHKYGLDHAEVPFIDYGEDKLAWEKYGETTRYRTYISLDSERQKICHTGEQLLSYFLDGSRRVFKVDDIAYQISGGRSVIYPVVAGQIGVACAKRTDKRLTCEKFKQEFVISIPDIANADGKSGFLSAVALKLNTSATLQSLGIQISDVLAYETSHCEEKKFEDKGTACIQDRMIEREKNMVADLVREGKIDQDNYLIKDGSLEYQPTKKDRTDKRRYQQFKQNYNWVLGASKNFNPEVCKDINGKPNPGFIADLPLYHRTPVACYHNTRFDDIDFAVWYVRIRDKSRTRTPFDGILKLEKMLVTNDESEYGMNSELVDLLTAHVINERNPTCYGSDMRWANHLYPIYLTESFIKSRYLSAENFLNLF